MMRPAEPLRSTLTAGLVCALVLSGGYLLYELGRLQGGYAVLDQRRVRLELQDALAERDAQTEELRRQIALLETSREIDRQTYAEVERHLGQLQARIQAQDEELAFYQGIVAPEDGVAGLRIQTLQVSPADSAQRYTLRLVLVQAIIHEHSVAGTVRVHIAGSRDGETVDLDLGDLAAGGAVEELGYAFRYFQDLEQDLVLPVGFEPDRIEVQVRPSEPDGEPVSQSFQWSAIVT